MIHTKFHEDWFSYSKVNREDTHADTHRQHGDFLSLLLFIQNKEIGQKYRHGPLSH
jgi:hypothetical protein